MKISCALGPTIDTPAHFGLAESLGYHCAYCFDAPVIGPDVFVTLALTAQRTSQIKLGTGMMIPRLRHPIAAASGYATLNRLAPGRIVMGVGSGFTGSRMLGQRAMSWHDVKEYIIAVRALLRGEEVEWDGALIKFVASPDFEKSLPVELPLIVAGDGPKGRQVARELGAGLCTTTGIPKEPFEWLATGVAATVLEDDESPESDRVWATVGPGIAIAYHAIYTFAGSEGVDHLPGGAAWRASIESLPAERRHLEIHRGHSHVLNEVDREFIPRSMAPVMGTVGTAEQVRQEISDLEQAGLTEILFNPAGPDIPRELKRFAEATLSLQDTGATRTAAV